MSSGASDEIVHAATQSLALKISDYKNAARHAKKMKAPKANAKAKAKASAAPGS